MDSALGALLLCVAFTALAVQLLGARGRSFRPPSAGSSVRSWTSPLTATQAARALVTVSQRLGYSVDPDPRPGITVLADSVLAGSYGQLFPVSLTTTGGGTLVRVRISAKDPDRALTEAVQERRLEDFARRMRAIFLAAEDDAGAERDIRA